MTDAELLDRHARTRDDAALAELVRRHADLVYCSARRHVAGDHHRAQELTQTVFLALARQAATLRRHPVLIAWLHQHTRFAASKLRQSERRRRVRETTAATDPALVSPASGDPPMDWSRVEPILEDALANLGHRDRETILLRYFSGHAYADIGQKLGLAENSARMRTERALEKLRRALAKRGVTSTASALGLALGANAVTAAPASVAASTLAALASPAALATAATSATGLTLLTTMTTSTKLTLGVSAAVLAAAGLGWSVYQAQDNSPQPVPAPPLTAPGSGTPSASAFSPLASAPSSISTSASTPTSSPSSARSNAATLADALAEPDAFKRKLALTALGHESATTDSAQALALLAQIKDPADRAAWVEGLMAAAAKMSAPDAISLAAELASGEDRRAGLVALARYWGVNTSDPEVIAYFDSDGLNEGTLGVLVSVQDPLKGIAWAEGLLDGPARRQALHDSLRQLARSAPQTALAYAQQSTDPQEKQSHLAGVALGWSEKDGPAAFAWAASFPGDPVTREALVSASALFWARQDSASATRAALAQPAELQTRALSAIAGSLYRQNPATAAAWLATLPEGPGKTEAARTFEQLKR